MPTIDERFWAKVSKDGPIMPHMDTPCWVWSAARVGKGVYTGQGYGGFSVNSQVKPAHRVAWMLHTGEWPAPGMQVRHACDNTLCVRIDHLSLGTNQDNANDRSERRTWPNQRKTHCPQGHAYDADNTYNRPDGARGCRTCLREACRKWRQNAAS